MITQITKNMNAALRDLKHNGSLSIHWNRTCFTASGDHDDNQHSIHTIQQLISDQMVSYDPSENNAKTGYITRIYPINHKTL